MNAFLLTLTAALIVVLSALFAAPLFIDWNDYRPVFETQASKLLGREVKVGGEVHLVLLPVPELRFDDVKVADRDGSFDQPLLEAKSIEAWLNIGALLTGKLEARKLAISDPVLRLSLQPDGTGNWNDIGRPGEKLPFAPKDVLLDQVSVSRGRIELARPNAPALVLEQVEGAASAASLSGPYKANAAYRFEGRPQEVRFSTSAARADGAFHLKTVLRDPDRASTYLLEGDVTGLNQQPAYAGAIVFRVAPSQPAQAQGAAAPDIAAPASEPNASPAETPAQEETDITVETEALLTGQAVSALELKGELEATPDRAELPSFELAIHSKGRSQILKGKLAVDFGERPKADGELSARWIDADALIADGGKADLSPAEALSALAGKLLAEAAKVAEGNLSLALEQASIGGDLITNIGVGLTAKDGVVVIDRLDAILPGESRLHASGKLIGGENGPVFEGPVKIEGSKLRTLTRWAAGDRDLSGQSAVGDFSLEANALLGGDGFTLTEASGELSGTKFSGTLGYQGGDRRVIELNLDSDRLDLREVLGDDVTLAAWLPGSAKPEAGTSPAEQGLVASLRDDKVHASLRVGELLLPNMPAGKLDAKFTLVQDTLDVESLDFSAQGALVLRGNGRIEALSRAPAGKIDLTLQAGSAGGLKVASGLFGLPESVARSKQLAVLAPLDIAARLNAVRADGGTHASAEVKGKAGGADLAILLKATGEPEELAKANIDLDATIGGERPEALLALLMPGLATNEIAAAAAGGRLSLKVQGVPSADLAMRAEIATAALEAGFEGRGSLKDEGLAFAGQASARSANAGLALQLLGLEASPAASGAALDLKAEIAKSGGELDLRSIVGEIAGEAVEGSAGFDFGGSKTRFSVDAKSDWVSLPALLGSLIAWQQTAATEEVLGAIAQAASDVWPPRSFALAPLANAEGEFKLAAKTLLLGAPFQVQDAVLVASVDQDGLKVTELAGQLFGGTLAGSGSLSPRGTGAELKAKANLTGGKLDQLTQNLAGRGLAKGPFDLSFEVSGEGLSPPGLVAGLSGEGMLRLEPGAVQALTPLPLRRVAAEAARKKNKLDRDQAAQRVKTLREGLTRGTYAYAAAEIPFDVKNGTLRTSPAKLINRRAATTVNLFIELASLKLDSEWEMQLAGAEHADVPPVDLVLAGSLNDVSAITPSIDTAPIESFMTVKRMQDDVERLETLDVSGRRPPQPDPGDAQTGPDPADALAAEQAAEEKAVAERAAEEKAAAEAKAAEEKRLADERAAAEAKAAEERGLADEKRRAEEKAAEERRLADEKAAAEAKAAEERRLAEEKRRAEEEAAKERRLAEEKRRAEQQAAEERRLAEEKAAAEKAAEERRLAEEKRLEEEKAAAAAKAAAEKAAEERRLAEERRKAEEKAAAQARAAAEKAAEERRLAEERAEAERLAEEKRRAEEKAAAEKAAEQKRRAEEKAAAEKAAEEKAAAEKAAEQRRLAEEKAAEQRRLAAERAAAEKAAEERRLAAEKAAAEQRAAARTEAEQPATQAPSEAPAPLPAATAAPSLAAPALAVPAIPMEEQLPWLQGGVSPAAAPLIGAQPPAGPSLPTEAALPTLAPDEVVPPLPTRPDAVTTPQPRRARKPVQREAPDDWKKGIPIFGGG